MSDYQELANKVYPPSNFQNGNVLYGEDLNTVENNIIEMEKRLRTEPINVERLSGGEGEIKTKISIDLLPTSLDDIMEFESWEALNAFIEKAEGKLYVVKNTNAIYRWDIATKTFIEVSAGDIVRGEPLEEEDSYGYNNAISNSSVVKYFARIKDFNTQDENTVILIGQNEVLAPINPLSQDGYQFFPITHYSQIVMADGSRWNGISVDKVIDEEGNEIFKMPTDKSLLIDSAPADAKITGQRIDACLLKSGGVMTGTLSIDRTIGNAATIDFINNTKPMARLTANTDGNHFTFWQFNAAGAYECYQLPTVKVDEAVPEVNQHLILTTKMPVTIAQGGTGAIDATTAIANLGAVNKAGDIMTGQLTVPNLVTDGFTANSNTQFNGQVVAKNTFIINNAADTPTLDFRPTNTPSNNAAFIAYRSPSIAEDGTITHMSAFQFNQYSYVKDSATEKTNFRDIFSLPTTATDLTANNYYNILTTKSPVTLEQGGTGVTTAPEIRELLGLGNTIGAVPIASGGTGATTAAEALENLEALPLAGGTLTGELICDAPITANGKLVLSNKLWTNNYITLVGKSSGFNFASNQIAANTNADVDFGEENPSIAFLDYYGPLNAENTASWFRFQQPSYNIIDNVVASTGFYERYRLPTTPAGLTSNSTHYIYTSKNISYDSSTGILTITAPS